jgi:hypothetical protein
LRLLMDCTRLRQEAAWKICACMRQGGADVADRQRGWGLLHLAAALGQEASLSFLLRRKLPVSGASRIPLLHAALACNVFTCIACLHAAHRSGFHWACACWVSCAGRDKGRKHSSGSSDQ